MHSQTSPTPDAVSVNTKSTTHLRTRSPSARTERPPRSGGGRRFESVKGRRKGQQLALFHDCIACGQLRARPSDMSPRTATTATPKRRCRAAMRFCARASGKPRPMPATTPARPQTRPSWSPPTERRGTHASCRRRPTGTITFPGDGPSPFRVISGYRNGQFWPKRLLTVRRTEFPPSRPRSAVRHDVAQWITPTQEPGTFTPPAERCSRFSCARRSQSPTQSLLPRDRPRRRRRSSIARSARRARTPRSSVGLPQK